MNTEDGNIPTEGKKEEEIRAGDVVTLIPRVLETRGKLRKMTPRSMYENGHPNAFWVLKTFETKEEGKCLVLECCDFYEDRKVKNSVKFRCNGHPAIYFKKIGEARLPQEGDKTAAIETPLGDLVRLEWKDDPKNPELKAKLFGINLGSLIGLPALMIKKLAEENKVL